MDKLKTMELLVKIVESGSFSQAAADVHIGRGQASTLISALESSLGSRLLNRTTRSVSLTSEGALYYEHCLRVLQDVDVTERTLANSQTVPSGTLRIDLPTAFAQDLVIPKLAEFFRRYPEVRVELLHSPHFEELSARNADVLMRVGPLSDSSLVAKTLYSGRVVTVASPRYLARHGIPQTPDELASHKCINYIDPKTGLKREWRFRKNGKSVNIKVPDELSMDESDLLIDAALNDLGIICVMQYRLRDYVDKGQLNVILSDWDCGVTPILLLFPRSRELSAKVRAFVDYMAEAKHAGLEVRSNMT